MADFFPLWVKYCVCSTGHNTAHYVVLFCKTGSHPQQNTLTMTEHIKLVLSSIENSLFCSIKIKKPNERILWLYLWTLKFHGKRVQLTLKWACIEILNYKVAPNVPNMAEFSPARKGPAQQLFQISLNISHYVMSQRQNKDSNPKY